MHEMNLQDTYYKYIDNGTKRIELRVNDEKRRKIKIGDTITFTNLTTNEKLLVRVVDLLYYDNFEKLIDDNDIAVLADKSITKEELLNILSEFYTKEEQEEYGVVGIKIEKISQ